MKTDALKSHSLASNLHPATSKLPDVGCAALLHPDHREPIAALERTPANLPQRGEKCDLLYTALVEALLADAL